jgi:hypothetical protein
LKLSSLQRWLGNGPLNWFADKSKTLNWVWLPSFREICPLSQLQNNFGLFNMVSSAIHAGISPDSLFSNKFKIFRVVESLKPSVYFQTNSKFSAQLNHLNPQEAILRAYYPKLITIPTNPTYQNP